MRSYSLFDTAFGRGAIAWGSAGVFAASFPSTEEKAMAGIKRRAPGADEREPDGEIAALIHEIAALFRGEKRDLGGARLDLSGVDSFEQGVYAATRAIPPGAVKTYGEIARALGDVALAQRVGQALGRNPIPVIVPCHRVIGADGRMTGFSAPGGTEAKMRLLKLEGGVAPDLFDRAP